MVLITVSPDGTGDFSTIAEAIAAAPEDAELLLSAGRHVLTESLRIERPINLIGAGMDSTYVVYDGAGWVVIFCLVDHQRAAVRGITFAHEGDAPGDVVLCVGATCDFRACRFAGGRSGISNAGAGLNIGGASVGRVINCELSSNLYGIFINEAANLTLQGNLCTDNELCGILAVGAATKLRRNRCSGSRAGMALSNGEFQVEGNVLTSNTYGLSIEKGARGEIRDNDCRDNSLTGISLQDDANVNLENNLACENGVGIAFIGQTTSAARHSTCSRNRGDGFLVMEEAQATLEGNFCESNSGSGIRISGDARGTAISNHCKGNENHGFLLNERANATLSANIVESNGYNGVAFLDDASGSVISNQCVDNIHHGFSAWDRSKVELRDNIALRNGVAGINFAEKSEGSAMNNECGANKGAGIHLTDESTGLIENNRSHHNENSGITCAGAAKATLKRNTCESNGESGIACFGTAAVSLEGNVCQGNAKQGISAWEHAVLDFVADTSLPKLINNDTVDNHRPNPASRWTLPSSSQGGRHRQHKTKEFAAKVRSKVEPDEMLLQIAQALQHSWRINGQIETRADLPDGCDFLATQSYQGQGLLNRQGMVSVNCIGFRENGLTMLNLAFVDAAQVQWLDIKSEGIVAVTLYGVAQVIKAWNSEPMPWVCIEGAWVAYNNFFRTPTGEFIWVER
jgi:parallel beta-helix repeat protein